MVTTTKDLIIQIHKTFVENRDKISSLKTFKKGVLPPLPAFPAMAILPMRDDFSYTYSGGKYRVAREYEIQIISKNMKKRDGRDEVQKLMDGCIRIIRDNFTFNDLCYDTYAESQDLEDPIERTDSILTVGTIKLLCYSFEYKPSRAKRSVSLYESKSAHLLSQLYDLFKYNKQDIDYPMSALKQLYVQTLGPKILFPCAILSEITGDRERAMAGIDVFEREVRMEIYTKMMDKDFALYQSLDLAENAKRIIQLDSTLGGAAQNSEIDHISYLRLQDESLGLLYNSIITMICQTREYLRDEEVMDEKDSKSW
jgi:hypothetical protein